jgi:hypothetical protein
MLQLIIAKVAAMRKLISILNKSFDSWTTGYTIVCKRNQVKDISKMKVKTGILDGF